MSCWKPDWHLDLKANRGLGVRAEELESLLSNGCQKHWPLAAREELPFRLILESLGHFPVGELLVTFLMTSIEAAPIPTLSQLFQPLMQLRAQGSHRRRDLVSLQEILDLADALFQRLRKPPQSRRSVPFLIRPALPCCFL